MNGFSRRSLLRFSLLGAGAAFAGRPASAASAAADTRASGPGPYRYTIDDTSAVADTESGKVIGYMRNDIRIFKGIPYGRISSPDGRWQRASAATPWTGKRSSRAPGPICPQSIRTTDDRPDELKFRASSRIEAFPDEDCLRLNVWTPGLDNGKRQVLFYLHGGGYSSGSSLMEHIYDGTNLAEYGDVVVVSINHRLNCLGFLDLAAYGDRWADSANVGMLDVVDALKWVNRNIAGFGGDPDKVMIFGHSGGGSKTATVMCMPEAKGLFNRAVVHSPGPLPLASPELSAGRTEMFFNLLGLKPGDVEALRDVPMERLIQATSTLRNRASDARDRFETAGTMADNDWRPTVDGRSVVQDPTQPTMASDVPMMIGTVLHESFSALGHPEYFQMDEAEARQLTGSFFGPVGDEIYSVYKGLLPGSNPFRISAAARAMGRMRGYCVKAAQHRAALGGAPTYNYWFQWESPNFSGLPMSFHTIEMPLVFQNSDDIPEFTGGTDEARELSRKMSDAWLAFARTGNPNTGALPQWNPVTPGRTNTMVFNAESHIDADSDKKAIDLFWASRNYS